MLQVGLYLAVGDYVWGVTPTGVQEWRYSRLRMQVRDYQGMTESGCLMHCRLTVREQDYEDILVFFYVCLCM